MKYTRAPVSCNYTIKHNTYKLSRDIDACCFTTRIILCMFDRFCVVHACSSPRLNSFSSDMRDQMHIREVIKLIEMNTCVRFERRNSERRIIGHCVVFVPGTKRYIQCMQKQDSNFRNRRLLTLTSLYRHACMHSMKSSP